MENKKACREGNSTKTPGTSESTGEGRPPPVVITSEANLISLQRELRSVVSAVFFFRNTATGTRVTAKSIVDYNAMQKFLTEKKSDRFLIFYTKADKPVKAVIRHMPPILL
jgi:hypothetical protein